MNFSEHFNRLFPNFTDCVPFVIEPEPRTVENQIRFALEGVLLPAVGIVGVVGKFGDKNYGRIR